MILTQKAFLCINTLWYKLQCSQVWWYTHSWHLVDLKGVATAGSLNFELSFSLIFHLNMISKCNDVFDVNVKLNSSFFSFRFSIIFIRQTACEKFHIGDNASGLLQSPSILSAGSDWAPSKFRIYAAGTDVKSPGPVPDTCEALSQLHGRRIYASNIISRKNLLSQDSR